MLTPAPRSLPSSVAQEASLFPAFDAPRALRVDGLERGTVPAGSRLAVWIRKALATAPAAIAKGAELLHASPPAAAAGQVSFQVELSDGPFREWSGAAFLMQGEALLFLALPPSLGWAAFEGALKSPR